MGQSIARSATRWRRAAAAVGVAIAAMSTGCASGPELEVGTASSMTSDTAVAATAAATAEVDAASSTTSEPVASTNAPEPTAPPTTIPPTTVPPATVPPPAPGVITVLRPGVEQLTYQHPTLGSMTITISDAGFDSVGFRAPSVIATVTATGQQVYRWQGLEEYETFGFVGTDPRAEVSSPIDARNHVFFVWNPGRFDGVSFLAPTDDGFTDGGTLADGSASGFYDATTVDVDADGTYELNQGFQICEPTCADGTYYSHIWRWDGTTYSGPSDPPAAALPATSPPAAGSVTVAAAERLLRDYLLAAGAREYTKAWGLLSAGYQADYGGFDSFTRFWDRIAVVGIDRMSTTINGGTATMTADLWFDVIGSGRQTDRATITMGVVGGQLRITAYTATRIE